MAMDFDVLIQQPEAKRDNAWEQAFLNAFAGMKVQLDSDQPKTGPDGFPYFFVRTSPDAKESVRDLVLWLAPRGIGMVVNAHKMLPDYIFPNGMLWNYVETGRYLAEGETQRAGDAVYQDGRKLLMGPPSDKYLPPYVRAVLREFLAAQGFTQPKILVISTPDYKQIDLMISTESLNNIEKKSQRMLADRLAWFLPLHYTLVLGSEQGFPPFHPL